MPSVSRAVRIGSFVFAAGLGIAVATGHGVAVAEPTDGGNEPSAESASQNPDAEPKDAPKTEPKGEPKDEPKEEPKDEPKEEPKDEPKEEPKVEVPMEVPKVEVPEVEVPEVEVPVEVPNGDEPPKADGSVASIVERGISPEVEAKREVELARSSEVPAALGSAQLLKAADSQELQQLSAEPDPDPTLFTASSLPVPTTRLAPDEQAAAVDTRMAAAPVAPTPGPVVSLLRGVVVAAVTLFANALDAFGLNFLVANNPVGPMPQPTLVGFLQLLRRQFEVTFFNQAPTVQPVQVAQSDGGVIAGTLGAVDPDGDTMVFHVTQAPTLGSVVVRGDGTFTYQPSAAFAAAGGVDQFTVSVSDETTAHLHAFGGSGVVSVPVTVRVTPGAGATVVVGASPSAVAVSPDGTRAYVTHVGDSTVVVLDTSTNAVLGTVAMGSLPVAVAVSPDGAKVYTADLGVDTVSVIDAATRSVTATIAVGASPTAVAVSADGSRLYVTNADSATLSIVSTASNAVIATVAVGGSPIDLAVSADGARVYVANHADATVSVIDTASAQLVATVAGVGRSPQGIAVTPDGTRVYVGSALDDRVAVIDVAGSAVVTRIATDGPVSALTVSADGTRLYATSAQGSVTVIDVATDTAAAVLDVGHAPQGIALSPNDTRLYVANGSDGTLSVVAVDPTTPLPAGNQQLLGSTAGFHVYNMTDAPVTLTGYRSTARPDAGGPGPGTVIPPGEFIDFEVVRYAFKTNTVLPTFEGEYGTYDVVLKVETFGGPAISTCSSGGGSTSCLPVANSSAQLDGYVLLQAPAQTTTVIPVSAVAAQTAFLNNFCYSGSPTTCSFKPTSQIVTYSQDRIVGNIVQNATSLNQTFSISTTDTVSNSDSISVTAKATLINIKKILNIELSATYQHTWTSTQTFTRTVTMVVPPNEQGYVLAKQQVYRDYGDFTLTAGGTSIVLQNVYFDTPIPPPPNGTGVGVYRTVTEPIPPN